MKAAFDRTNLLWVVFFLLFMAGLSTPVYATVEKGPVQKLARGFTHVLTAIFQVPKEIIQTTAEAEPVYLAPWKGFTVGSGTGLYLFGRQLVSGFNDIFTFWTPLGRDWAPLFEPSTLFPGV